MPFNQSVLQWCNIRSIYSVREGTGSEADVTKQNDHLFAVGMISRC